jgi:tetratricopeptide (TPR) repeat protein
MFIRRHALVCTVLAFSSAAFAQSGDPEALIKAGHFKEVERLVAGKSQNAETLYLMAVVKDAFRKPEEALPLAEGAVKADPGKARYHLELAGLLGQQAEKASMFRKISLAGRIRSELETALKLEPKNVDCLEGMMQYYIEAPGIAGGSKDKAREMAEEIGRVDPSMGYLAQAEIARSNKESDKLEQLYLSAIKANPKNIEALVAMSQFYASDAEKKYDEAEKYVKQAMDADRTVTASYSVAAQIAVLRKALDKAEAAVEQSEKANHDDLNPYYQAARVMLQTNIDLPRAERYLRKYLSQQPEGNTPNLSAAHWRLGLVLEKEGRKSEAIHEMEESLKLQPDFENAKKDLKRLKG